MLYLTALVPFCVYVNQNAPLSSLCAEYLSFLMGQFAMELDDHKVRAFHASVKFFMPFCNPSRVTAELKGIEKSHVTVPTTPFTVKLVIALSFFARQHYGIQCAVGVLVAFFGLLRSQELIRVRPIDVMMRQSFNSKTAIRLGVTKNNREQICFIGKNTIAERGLRFLMHYLYKNRMFTNRLFGFSSYQDLWAMLHRFKVENRIPLHLTPHSLRSGGATFYKMNGRTMTEVCDLGRWENLKSARQYVDSVFALLPETLQLEQRVFPTHERAIQMYLAPKWE